MSARRREPDWTAEEDALIMRPTRPLGEIARDLGRTVMAVYNRRTKMGWTDSRPPPHRVAKVDSAGKRVFPQRSFAAKDYVKPQMLAERRETVIRRPCLSCRTPFSTTRFVFVCGPCKKSTNWDCAI